MLLLSLLQTLLLDCQTRVMLTLLLQSLLLDKDDVISGVGGSIKGQPSIVSRVRYSTRHCEYEYF